MKMLCQVSRVFPSSSLCHNPPCSQLHCRLEQGINWLRLGGGMLQTYHFVCSSSSSGSEDGARQEGRTAAAR